MKIDDVQAAHRPPLEENLIEALELFFESADPIEVARPRGLLAPRQCVSTYGVSAEAPRRRAVQVRQPFEGR
jgi:hypothetical protein